LKERTLQWCLDTNELLHQQVTRNTDGLILKESTSNAMKSRSNRRRRVPQLLLGLQQSDESLMFLTRLLSERHLCGNQGGDIPRRKVGVTSDGAVEEGT
jgi:hypothetical protein